jgi:hypothetical protein
LAFVAAAAGWVWPASGQPPASTFVAAAVGVGLAGERRRVGLGVGVRRGGRWRSALLSGGTGLAVLFGANLSGANLTTGA